MRSISGPKSKEPWALTLLAEARTLFENGHVAQAEALLGRILAKDPREKESIFALGIIAAKTGRRDLAVERMVQVLKIDPNFSPALCSMSAFLLQVEHIAEALSYAERAVTADPNNADSLASLARCLVKQARHLDAIPYFRKATRLNPADPTLSVELADVLLAVHQDWDAAEILRRTVANMPDPRSLVNLGNLELGFGRISEAERYCSLALQLRPNLPQAHLLMARIFTEQFQVDQAENHWLQADRLGPNPGSIHVDKALSLSAIGKVEESVAELRHAIELLPRDTAAYRTLVFAKKIRPEDSDLIEKMEAMLAEGELDDSDRLNLLYALGKANDNLQNFGQTIDFFDRANQVRKRLNGARPFDRKALSALIDAKIQRFTKRFFGEWSHGRSESDVPVWVVGMMRSGTTLTEHILTCHPQVGGAGEQDYWSEAVESLI